MKSSSERAAIDGPTTGAGSAAALRSDRARVFAARRLLPRNGGTAALDRLAALASTLLGTASAQVSLLEDVQFVAGGSGLADGTVGSVSPWRSRCAR